MNTKRVLLVATAGLLALTALSCTPSATSGAKPIKAPAIVGVDENDKEFALSDYRGKVVMLDFYGMWCGPCVRMFPHNRSLVTKFKDKPFVLLGVNTDSRVETLQAKIKSGDITWRSWWDGPNSPNGPIASAYDVDAFPTIFLIDGKGMIRKQFRGQPSDTELDSALAALIAEAEKDAEN